MKRIKQKVLYIRPYCNWSNTAISIADIQKYLDEKWVIKQVITQVVGEGGFIFILEKEEDS